MAFGNLTVDFRQLARVPVRDRVALAQSAQASEIFGNLTPSQIAALFPDYYKKFIPQGGGGGSMAAGLTGAGTTSSVASTGFGTAAATGATAPTVPTRPGFIQDIIGDVIPSTTVGTGAQYGEGSTNGQVEVLKFARRWGISPQAAAGVLNIESGVRSNIQGGAGGNFYGVFQLQGQQIPNLTERAGFGRLTPQQYKNLSVGDQLKVMDEYYKQWNVQPGFFTGDPQKDAAKMWALQLSPGLAKKINYDDPNAVISNTDQAGVIEAKNKLVTVGSAGAGSVPGGVEFLKGAELSTAIPGTSPITGQALEGSDAQIQNLLGTPADASVRVVPPPQGPAKTMLLSLGTNDFGDPSKTYKNTLDAINEGRKKGYNVVVVPPVGSNERFKAAYDEVMRAVNETGASVEQPQSYSADGYHPTADEYKRIGEKYQGAIVVGDSIAVGIGQHVDNGKTVATEGIRTDAILSRLRSEEIAKLDTAQIVPQVSGFDPSIFTQIDPRLKEYYDTAPDGEKRAIEVAIQQKGVATINEVMAKYPKASATAATTQTLEAAGYIITDKLGNITPQPRKWDASRDDPGASVAGEFNYSLTSEGAQNLGLADASGRVSRQMVEKGLVTIQTNSGVKVKVHKSIAQNATDFLNALEARGYPLRQQDTAGYVWRNKSSGNSLSTHATGTTLDLNWNSNWGTFGSANNIDFPPDVEKLANMHGFSWGAKFGDPMHFETMSPALYQEKLKTLEKEGYIQRRETQVEAQQVQQQQLVQQTAQPLDGTQPITQEPRPDDTAQIPLQQSTANTAPAMKLGGEMDFKEPNSVKESMSLVANGKEVAKFNKNEEVNVADGKINVQNEYQKKTNETQQKTDKGAPPANQYSMRQTAAPETPRTFPDQVKYGIVPQSPSARRQFETAQFGGYDHFSRRSHSA